MAENFIKSAFFRLNFEKKNKKSRLPSPVVGQKGWNNYNLYLSVKRRKLRQNNS